jgi:predicted SnoaL-like aldol condensation-catalyzing enzyme
VTIHFEQNVDFVLAAFDTLFNRRDFAKAEAYWSEQYVQHGLLCAGNRTGLFDRVQNSPADLRYDHDMAIADANFVWLHGRFTLGISQMTWAVVDILRLHSGTLVEHWNVIQREAPPDNLLIPNPLIGGDLTA